MQIRMRVGLAVVTGLLCAGACAAPPEKPVTINLPPDHMSFKPGAGAQVAQGNCTICHAADYVYIQPPLTGEKWRAEVNKMQKVYGCPVAQDAVDALVNYLVAQNGAPAQANK